MAPTEPRTEGPSREQVATEVAVLGRLNDFAARFLHDGSLPSLLGDATLEAADFVGADRACLQIVHGEGGGLRMAAQHGLERPFLDYVASLRTGLGGSIVREQGTRIVIDDVSTSRVLTDSPDRVALLAANVRSLSVTPLVSRSGRVVGLLSTLHRTKPTFADHELALLDRVATLCAGAVEHSRAAERRAAPNTAASTNAAFAERLRQTEELFRNTVENMPVNLVLCDRDARLLYLNPALAAMVGAMCKLTPEQIVGKQGADVWPPAIWDPLSVHLQKAITTGQRQTYEQATLLPNAEPMVRQWTVVPLAGADGEVHRLLAISHDVTAQRRLVDELREADRRKSEFISVLSHELRNPLAAIRASMHVLESEDTSIDGRTRRGTARKVIDRQVGHLVRMVDDLLDVTRISQNKIQLQQQPLDLSRVVREAIEDNRTHLESRGVRLHAELAAGPLIVNADAVRLAQVVTNLLSNAAKFTPSGGSATVSVYAEGGNAVINVTDTGCGIEPSLLPRVFDPFMQAERTLDRAGGGLGLGLALVKGLVGLHGGRVSAKSGGNGQGSTFAVRLPLEPATGAQLGGAWPIEPRRGRRVLVIDDDRDVAEGLQLALEIERHEVAVAHSGQEALETARSFRPEIVLCDVGLPNMDGYEVARAFRADPALRSVFLVAFTGYAQSGDLEKARSAGFDEHVAKPSSFAKIQELVAGSPVAVLSDPPPGHGPGPTSGGPFPRATS